MKMLKLRHIGPARWPLVLAAVVVVALTSLLVREGLSLQTVSAARGERDAVTSAARDSATAFTTYDHATLDASFEPLMERSTKRFQDEFTAASTQLRPLIKKKKARAAGEVVGVAIETLTSTKASVLVAVDAEVHNDASPKGAKQLFRLKLGLRKVDGAWLLDQITTVV